MPKPILVVDRPLGDAVSAEAIARVKARKAQERQTFDRSLGDTYEEYLQEMTRIRSDLKRFVEYFFGFQLEAHHLYIVRALMDLIHGKIPNNKLAFIAPPNSAKSTYSSVALPLFYLGNHPDQSLMFVTSSDQMAQAFNNTIKGVFEESEDYHSIFPSKDLQPNPRRGWSGDGLYLRGANPLEKDPSYKAIGTKTSIMGGRAHGIIFDDPLSHQDAQSDTAQQGVIDLHDMTIEKRLHRPSQDNAFEGWMVSIGTRWKESDWLKHLEDRGDYTVINFPVRATTYDPDNPNTKPDPLGREPGEVLWPTRYTDDYLASEEKALGAAKFNCVFMGDPTSLGGDVFKSESWFQDLPSGFFIAADGAKSICDSLPRIQAYDTAFSERDTACYTVGITACVDKDLNLYIIDVMRERLSTKAFERRVADDAMEYHPVAVAIEEASFRHTVVRRSVRAIKKLCRYNVYSVAQTADKVARAQLPANRAEGMQVYVDHKAPWYPAFVRECLGFPRAAYKDQVDAFGLLAEMVEIFEKKKTEKVVKMHINTGRHRRRWREEVA